MTSILGLSYNYHDAAGALLQDGEVVAAATEERHTRRKHDARYPTHAVEDCLRQAGIASDRLDWVAYYEQPLVKFGRILDVSVRHWRSGGKRFLRSTVESWARKQKFDVREQIAVQLGVASERILYCDHHLSHAASAFFCSPFERATIVTLDGVGEWETCTISRGENNSIEKVAAVNLPHSLGLFYSALTAYLGFEVNEGEYKVMGMAGFGRPIFRDRLLEWFSLRRGGTFRVRRELLRFDDTGDELTYIPELVEAFGPPRKPEAVFDLNDPSEAPGSPRHYANVAASLQAATEVVIEHVVREALDKTSIPALCMAGGVALNSAANQRLRRALGIPMFVQPAAGDAGGALGAAKWLHHMQLGNTKRECLTSAFLGASYAEDVVLREVRDAYGSSGWIRYDDDASLCKTVAELLSAGKVVGWFQGRSEWGPRALGNRSILATPCVPEMQRIVNEKIKFREPFRPFAPAVAATRAPEFFDLVEIPGEHAQTNPYNFMLAISHVKPEAKDKIPAVTHVDGTARVQTVRPEINPLFFNLIEAFEQRSGVPVILNTSFNLRGEPIVETPKDAINTFEWSGMDALVLGRVVVTK